MLFDVQSPTFTPFPRVTFAGADSPPASLPSPPAGSSHREDHDHHGVGAGNLLGSEAQDALEPSLCTDARAYEYALRDAAARFEETRRLAADKASLERQLRDLRAEIETERAQAAGRQSALEAALARREETASEEASRQLVELVGALMPCEEHHARPRCMHASNRPQASFTPALLTRSCPPHISSQSALDTLLHVLAGRACDDGRLASAPCAGRCRRGRDGTAWGDREAAGGHCGALQLTAGALRAAAHV